MTKTSKAIKSISLIIIMTAIAKVLGFGKETILAAKFGTGFELDAYLMASSIPIIFLGTIGGGALGVTFIPIFTNYIHNKKMNEGMKFCNYTINLFFIVTIIMTFFGVFGAKYYMPIIAKGFNAEGLTLTIKLTQYIFPIVIFTVLAGLLTAMLQSLENFFVPSLIQLTFSITIIIYLLLFSNLYGIIGLAIATIIGSFTQVFIQYIAIKKEGFNYSLDINFKNEGIREMLKLLGPVIIGTSVQQLNILVDRMLASGLVEGSISALNFANKLIFLPYSIIIVSITSVAYPQISKLVLEKNNKMLSTTVDKLIKSSLLLIMPIVTAFVVLNTPIVQFVFERGAFGSDSTIMTASALLFYSFSLIGLAVRDILYRVFYSIKDTKTPLINGVIVVTINIILNLILINYLQHRGLALATSVSLNITTIILLIKLKSVVKSVDYKGLLLFLIKTIIASLGAGFTMLKTYEILSDKLLQIGSIIQQLLLLGMSFVLGFIVYTLLVWLLKVEEINFVIQIVQQKLKMKSFKKEK